MAESLWRARPSKCCLRVEVPLMALALTLVTCALPARTSAQTTFGLAMQPQVGVSF